MITAFRSKGISVRTLRPPLDPVRDADTRESAEYFKSFIDEASDLVLRYGGSLSCEHGDGQARGSLLPKMYGAELVEAFREFKTIFDPDWKMNPGKSVDAYLIDENLRLGAGYN